MFDTIGIVDDPDGPRRKALSSGLAGVLVGAVVTLVLVVGARGARPLFAAQPPPSELSLVYLEIEEQAEPPEAPPLVEASTEPAGAVRPAPSAAPTAPVDSPPTDSEQPPGEILEDPAVTPELAPPRLVMLSRAPKLEWDGRGGPRGHTTERADGAMGTAMARLPQVGFETLNVRRQLKPTYPPSESREVTCRAAVRISADGSPSLVRVSDCPKLFAEATREAVRKWRWERPMVDGVNRAVESTYAILFVPEER